MFGLAAVNAVRLIKTLDRRFRPKFVWLVTTWIALLLSLVDPFLPTAPIAVDRVQAPAEYRPRMLGQ